MLKLFLFFMLLVSISQAIELYYQETDILGMEYLEMSSDMRQKRDQVEQASPTVVELLNRKRQVVKHTLPHGMVKFGHMLSPEWSYEAHISSVSLEPYFIKKCFLFSLCPQSVERLVARPIELFPECYLKGRGEDSASIGQRQLISFLKHTHRDASSSGMCHVLTAN